MWKRGCGGDLLSPSNFPFDRDSPAPQLAFRTAGISASSRVRDGAGFGSFAVMDPTRLRLPDPLAPVRSILFENLSKENTSIIAN